VYTKRDLLTGTLVSLCNLIGATGVAFALQVGGQGATIYSITSLSILIPLFLNILIKGLYPSPLQNLGILLGIAGAVITARI